VQLHPVEPHLQTIGVCRNLAISGKQRQLPLPLASFIEGFDQSSPSLALAVIDLAEIKHLPLDHFAAGATFVLDDVPVAMLLAVLEASVEAQEHDANQLTPTQHPKERYLVYTTADLQSSRVDPTRVLAPHSAKIAL
jgi:hypothetical protein